MLQPIAIAIPQLTIEPAMSWFPRQLGNRHAGYLRKIHISEYIYIYMYKYIYIYASKEVYIHLYIMQNHVSIPISMCVHGMKHEFSHSQPHPGRNPKLSMIFPSAVKCFRHIPITYHF